MNHATIVAKLKAIQNMRAFCRRHDLPWRTVYRAMETGRDPRSSTLERIEAALKAEARKPMGGRVWTRKAKAGAVHAEAKG